MNSPNEKIVSDRTLSDGPVSRRHFLSSSALSLGTFATTLALAERSVSAKPPKPELEPRSFDMLPKSPTHTPKAKAMISLWMQGGPSHMDLCDPKPKLTELDGKPFPGKIKYDNAAQASSKILGSPWRFKKYGQSGMDFSELVPHMASVADELCLIRSMRTGVNNHGQSIRAMNCGRILGGQPSLGSWLTYGLGAETPDLPGYLALIDPGQLPVLGVENWSNGWLPALFHGTVIRPTEPRILNLTPPKQLRGAAQKRYLQFLSKLNTNHLKKSPTELDLQARIASFELAERMQISAKEALDLSRETAHTKRMYGLEDTATADFGTRCLIARRLIERGVRFVQVFTQNQYWDHHNGIKKSLPKSCKKIDQPAAALVRDLKQRGLLDSTVVHWGGEMGRLPVIQNDAGDSSIGRDHNTYGFSMWVAGGGFKSGHIHGATDEFGHKAVEDVVNHFDYHATMLHLFGIDPNQLTYRLNNQQRSLLEGKGKVVKELLS